MTRPSLRKTAAALAAFAVIAGLFAHFVYRPWQMNWGATEEEIHRAMPGDRVVGEPSFTATRAVTLDASPEQIWPWLVQMGYKQAGFYSWDFLDNARIPSAETILPEYQNLRVGDRMPLDADDDAVVDVLVPNQHLSLIFLPDSLAT